jgi:putative flippase GtrA
MVLKPRFMVFVLVGVACAAIDVGLMVFLRWVGLHYLLATSLGFVAGFAVNFLLHSRITFRAQYTHGTLFRFMVVVVVNFLLSIFMVFVFQEWMNAALWGKLLSLPLVSVNGFFLSKHWVFR